MSAVKTFPMELVTALHCACFIRPIVTIDVNLITTGGGARRLAEIWQPMGEGSARVLPACQLLWPCGECQWKGQMGGHTGMVIHNWMNCINCGKKQCSVVISKLPINTFFVAADTTRK